MNRVVITGMGWITPMGHDVEGVWRRLLAGESGIEPPRSSTPSTFPTTFGAEVKDFRLADHIADDRAARGRRAEHAVRAGGVPQAWKAAGLDARRSSTSTASASTSAAARARSTSTPTRRPRSASWKAEAAQVDSVKWAEVAHGADAADRRAGAGAEHAAVAPGAADRRRAGRR